MLKRLGWMADFWVRSACDDRLGGGYQRRRGDTELFYAFQSFVCPNTVFRYDFATGVSQALFTSPIQFDFSRM